MYADFMHQRPRSVSKDTKIPAIYYHKNTFNLRTKTVEVNDIVQKFLYKQRIYLNKPTPAGLVSGMQKWILNGKLYDEILQRERTAATLLLQAYGMTEKNLMVNQARAILLQWEDNNAQTGYTYKKIKKKILGIDINNIKKDQEKERKEQVKQKTELFLRENNIDTSINNLQQPEKSPYMHSTNEDDMVRQRVAIFLSEQGVACHASNQNVLAETVSHWILLEGATQDIIDMVKVKQIAQVILNEKVDGVISNEHAEITFTKWLWDLIKANDSLLTVVPRSVSNESVVENSTVSSSTDLNGITLTESTNKEDKESKETVNKEQWRSPKVMKQVEDFFRNKGLLIGMAKKEDVLSAMGRWFIEAEKETIIMPEKVQAVASVILKELKLYGGSPDEMISDSSAERTVMKWTFENVLGSSIEAYIAKQIVEATDPSAFTIGQLRSLFMFEELKKAGLINLSQTQVALQHGIRAEDAEMYLKKLWISLSNRALPHYLLKSSNLPDKLLISDYHSLTQLTGASLMADLGFSKQFNQTETRLLGEFFLETLSFEGIHHFEELSFLLTPALLTVAQLEPDKMQEALVKGDYIEVALTTFIGYSHKGYLQMMKTQAIADDLVLTYRQAVVNWRRKVVLVDEVLAECNRLGIKLDLAASQVYLAGGNPCPGPWIPPDLERWYTRLTKDVSDSFHLLNEFLIQLSIQSIGEQELDFLFSPDSRIYPASAQFKSEVRQYQFPINLRSVPPLLFYKQEELLNSTLHLNQTDLIVVIKGNEKRWYALKQVEKGGYNFYRVDKDPFLFLTYGLMDQNDLWDGQFRKNGDKIRIGKEDYSFTTKVYTDKEFSLGDAKQTLANQISLKHRDALYQQLYDSGNEQTTATKVWNVLKHVIPFYDCVVGISEQNVEEAVPNCLIDAVSLIPILGQVTTFNMRFALGVAKSVVKSGLSVTLKTSTRFLPTLTELRGLLVNAIRYLDPGVELLSGGGRFILKRLVDFSNEQFIGKELKAALTKLDDLGSKQTDWTKSYVTARLTKDGPEVRVKRMPNNLYLRVSDLRNGDVSGKYFTLRGDQLREFEGPATFTPRQKVVIQRLSRTLDVDQVFVEEPNLNPKAYGEGNVFTFKKRDGQRVSVLQMDGHMIPVEITVLKKHGVRYDVSDGEQLLPVNFNGIEWYFEPPTSPIVMKSVEIDVTNRINQFEALWDPSILSPPDERGLMWNMDGRSYIKINDRYLPLILLDKEVDRYHLVKKDFLETMTVLRFDPINHSFRFESELEKQTIDIQNQIRRTGAADKSLPGTSSDVAGSSQEGTAPSQLLPNTPGRWKEWNEIRQAVVVGTDPLPRVTDKNVECKKLTAFIPEPQIEVILDEKSTQIAISKGIEMMYHSQPVDYQVFSGLDISKVPDYLKPYFKEMSDGFFEAINYFKTTKERCIELLKLNNIAETPEGKYAAEMFDMYLIENREPYLKEIFKRLLTVAEKGERFLRQSADWGFKNIWIVSTELAKSETTQAFYSKVEAIPKAYAFILSHDPECRIIFIADTNHIDPDYMPKMQISVDPKETLIHETTHIVAMAYDVIPSYPYMVSGYSKSGVDVRNQYFKKYTGFFKTNQFTRYVDQLADYQQSPTLSEEAVILAEKSDAMMSMNIQILDAETLMIMIRDVALGNPFNKRPVNQRPKLLKRDLSNNQNKPKINGEMLVTLALMNSGQFHTAERNSELTITQKQSVKTTTSPLTISKTNQNKPLQKKRRINKLVGFSTKISGFVNGGQVNTPAKRKSDLNLQK
ncbi:QWxxN domain [Enterococcus mundtii]|uniref:QWxxN domain n=1 Tax=Enterococcus mundtii TaxID=53346 RepID=UPI00325BA96B